MTDWPIGAPKAFLLWDILVYYRLCTTNGCYHIGQMTLNHWAKDYRVVPLHWSQLP